jgi:class 3 adenylate cyclase
MIEQRLLAPILVADVVGYSELVGSDEAGTLEDLHALRPAIRACNRTRVGQRRRMALGGRGFACAYCRG